MCTADKKIDRLENKMSDVEVRISVLETKLDAIQCSLDHIETSINKDKDKSGDRTYQVLFWLVTVVLGLVVGIKF